MITNNVSEGSCVTQGATASYQQKMKSLYICTTKCPNRHENLDYWYLLNKYSPKTQNFDVFITSWKKSLRTVLVVYLSVPFLLKSSYTLLRMLKCLKLYAWNCIWGQDTPDCMEISSYPCNCIIFIIKVINYALWHTFESKRYMYFHNKTWYTCTHCYM